MWTNAFHRRRVKRELAFGITIAGVESFAIARTALNQLSVCALRARDRRFIWLIDGLGVIALRIMAATNKHAEAPLPQDFICATLRARMTLQHFNNMTIALVIQWSDIIASWVIDAAKKRPVFACANN